jgi:glycosyltransferase involved in cell wall biosynthesis
MMAAAAHARAVPEYSVLVGPRRSWPTFSLNWRHVVFCRHSEPIREEMTDGGKRQPVTTIQRRPCIGLVVPALEEAGGLAAVAEFVCEAVEYSQAFNLRIVSLAMSSRNPLSVSLTRAPSWFRGVTTLEATWRGRRFIRIGAFASELEFQRYRPRRPLRAVLADCDVIQVVCGSPACALAVCGLNKPIAMHCATRAVVERRSRHAKLKGPSEAWRRCMTMVTDRMDRKALRSVDAIQVENAWMFDYARGLNVGRTEIVQFVPPGVNSLRFKPAARRDLHSDRYVLTVGRLNDPRKNVAMLLDAFGALPASLRSDVRLVLAGSAYPSREFWARVQQFGLDQRVTFANSPTVDELVALYQTATVFASSSDEEGFGVSIVEAMACGIPVVSTRSGGPDGIIRDGHDGYLTEIGNVGEFTDRLRRLLSNEALNQSMGEAARKAVLERFDSRVARKALLETYDALLKVGVPPGVTESRAAILPAQ